MELEGGGLVVSLGAWTELMCVRRLWEANWREKGEDGRESGRERELADICVERLRRAAMCRADIETLSSFRVAEGGSGKRLQFVEEMPRQRCVDWNALESKVSSRVVRPESLGGVGQI